MILQQDAIPWINIITVCHYFWSYSLFIHLYHHTQTQNKQNEIFLQKLINYVFFVHTRVWPHLLNGLNWTIFPALSAHCSPQVVSTATGRLGRAAWWPQGRPVLPELPRPPQPPPGSPGWRLWSAARGLHCTAHPQLLFKQVTFKCREMMGRVRIDGVKTADYCFWYHLSRSQD